MTTSERQRVLGNGHNVDLIHEPPFFLICRLMPTGTLSHTAALMNHSREIMDANGVGTELLRPVDFEM